MGWDGKRRGKDDKQKKNGCKRTRKRNKKRKENRQGKRKEEKDSCEILGRENDWQGKKMSKEKVGVRGRTKEGRT